MNHQNSVDRAAFELAELVIKTEEGFEPNVYICSEGYPTVGYGERLGYKGQPLSDFAKYPEVREASAVSFLRQRVELNCESLEANMPYWNDLSPLRRALILSMAYQLGYGGLMKFRRMHHALSEGDFEAASVEMLDSRWARQTANRAERTAEMMSTGELVSYYV